MYCSVCKDRYEDYRNVFFYLLSIFGAKSTKKLSISTRSTAISSSYRQSTKKKEKISPKAGTRILFRPPITSTELLWYQALKRNAKTRFMEPLENLENLNKSQYTPIQSICLSMDLLLCLSWEINAVSLHYYTQTST